MTLHDAVNTYKRYTELLEKAETIRPRILVVQTKNYHDRDTAKVRGDTTPIVRLEYNVCDRNSASDIMINVCDPVGSSGFASVRVPVKCIEPLIAALEIITNENCQPHELFEVVEE